MDESKTVAELLRECGGRGDEAPCYLCHEMFGDGCCPDHRCRDAWGALADRVEAEVAEARDLSAREGMAIIAEAEGWPPLRDGESVTEWMARCWLPRPRYEGGEIVDIGDGLDGTEVCSYEVSDTGTWELFDPCSCGIQTGMAGERVKRPAPEVLLADGLPAEVGDTVYNVDNGHEYVITGLPMADRYHAVLLAHGPSGVEANFDPDRLTHEEPDSIEHIEADARLSRAIDYWSCGTNLCDECPSLVDGETPRRRYGVESCITAMTLDLLRRQRAVFARGGE